MKFIAMSDLDHMYMVNARSYEDAIEGVKRLFKMQHPDREIFVSDEDAWTEVCYADDDDRNLVVYVFDLRVLEETKQLADFGRITFGKAK